MKGSLQCAWDPTFAIIHIVPKYTTEKVKNLIDFKCRPKGSYTCKICGYYVIREHCGALKAVEYDEGSGYITIYHTGSHIYNIKPLEGESNEVYMQRIT